MKVQDILDAIRTVRGHITKARQLQVISTNLFQEKS